ATGGGDERESQDESKELCALALSSHVVDLLDVVYSTAVPPCSAMDARMRPTMVGPPSGIEPRLSSRRLSLRVFAPE
ncbi:MAG TPA: hypothetical protein VKD67_07475, partial [Acidimicrobiales bacterium]|nr:hypothetical protein [Acidimicrobiales bacterium]